MSQLPDKVERRIELLLDKKMYDNDAYYHALVSNFRQWLMAFDFSMEEEDIPPEIRARVLDRVVYGMPSAAEAYERQAVNKQILIAMEQDRNPIFRFNPDGTFYKEETTNG